jgi:malate dehydrogenase (oxaloacetate-decarboxylating)(NADP+)
VFVSGSPFPSYEMYGKKFESGQGNNAYIFPGVALGTICCGLNHIDEDVFLLAAQTLSDLVSEDDIALGRMYPPLSKIRKCSVEIASRIAEKAYHDRIATVYPEPEDKTEFIKEHLYDYNYEGVSALPVTYNWPTRAAYSTNTI